MKTRRSTPFTLTWAARKRCIDSRDAVCIERAVETLTKSVAREQYDSVWAAAAAAVKQLGAAGLQDFIEALNALKLLADTRVTDAQIAEIQKQQEGRAQ